MRLVLTPRAQREIRRIDHWWRNHREKAPHLFRQEVDDALRLIALLPSVGSAYRGPHGQPLRRFHMEQTHHHLYYRVEREEVLVLTIWGAVKREPRF